jgi:electron transfer flavoprotein alpha subunit
MLIGKGHKLADKLDEELWAVILGHNIVGATEIVGHYGAQKILAVDNDLLDQYTADAYTPVLIDLVFSCVSSYTLI